MRSIVQRARNTAAQGATSEVNNRTRGILLVLVAALLWSGGGIGIKAAEASALKVAFYRSLFASAAFLLIRRGIRARFTPRFIVAVTSYAACLTTFVIATKLTTAANAIFLQYSGVIWVLLFSPIVLSEPLRRREVIAIIAALFGMGLFFVGKLEAGGMTGNLIALLSGVFFASLILTLRLERGLAAEAAVTWGSITLTIVLFPFVVNDLALDVRSGTILLLLGVFQIALAYAAFVEGLKHITATEASLIGMLEPVANPLWVFLFLGERPSVYALVGGAIVLLAIGWNTITTREPKVELPPVD